MTVGVILAAGISQRFNSTVHKQYLKLNGKEVIYYSLSEMRDAGCFDEVVVVVDSDEFRAGYIAKKYKITCIQGGNTRNKSIKMALDYVATNYKADNILIHDCVRPFIKSETYAEFIGLLKTYDAVAMTSNITDSLVTTEGEFVNRRDFLLIQTPEAFKFEKLYKDFNENKQDTAIINQLKDKSNILLHKVNVFNFKITYPQDLFLAEQLMRIDFLRTSMHHATNTISGKVLLLGGSGGLGKAITQKLTELGIEFFAPTHKELDLYALTVSELEKVCPFKPDIIINAAAAYANDEKGLISTYEMIFDVNLRSNLVLIEYAKTLGKRVNLVVMSSSSSTRGRENLTNYSAAKAALNSIVESQGHILSEQNILLNAIIPEKINTPLIEKLHKTAINKRELLDVDEVLDAILLCATTSDYGKLIHLRKGL